MLRNILAVIGLYRKYDYYKQRAQEQDSEHNDYEESKQ